MGAEERAHFLKFWLHIKNRISGIKFLFVHYKQRQGIILSQQNILQLSPAHSLTDFLPAHFFPVLIARILSISLWLMHMQKPDRSSCSFPRPVSCGVKGDRVGSAARVSALSPLHPANTRLPEIYCGCTTQMTLIESFCFMACTLHGINFWPKSPCKKSKVPGRDSGSSCGLRQSTPESELCGYKILAEHSLPLRLYAQCQLLQQKDNRAV